MNVPLLPIDDTMLELAEVPDGYEMIDGQLVELNVGTRSSWVGGRLFGLLDEACRQRDLGWAFPADTAFRCFASKKTVRKPDVSFIRRGRLPNEELPEGDAKIVPDLAVEVVSPNDQVYELDRKIEEYLAAGVRLVWVVNPDVRLVVVHRLDGTMAKVREGQELSGEDVVPGFKASPASFLPPLPAAKTP